jgi:orotate phosphoribosyltransferase
LDELREQLIEIVRGGLTRLDEPVQLASGDMSSYFVDCKKALARGRDLKLAGDALAALAKSLGATFDAVGGLTMGADALAHAVAISTDTDWFSVRKKEKDRGTRKRIEGADLGPGRRVLLVDDVVTRGGSIFDALNAIQQTGAVIAGAVTLVDRGIHGAKKFAEEGIPYQPLVTYEQLGIPPVGSE